MTDNEWVELSHEMERQDGFKKREKDAIANSRGKNMQVLEHALMRGLRRGIGLYIKEVSSPAYLCPHMYIPSSSFTPLVTPFIPLYPFSPVYPSPPPSGFFPGLSS